MSETWEDFDDIAFDQEFSEKLRQALDVEVPTPEAEERMLATLLAAQQERVAQDGQDDVAVDSADIARFELPEVSAKEGFELVEGYGARQQRKRRRVVGLAVAASIVIALVNVGIVIRANKAESGAASDMQYESAEATSEETSSSDKAGAEVIVVNETVALPVDEGLVPEMEAMGGGFDVTGDPSYALASTYQLIYLEGMFDLRIEEHDGGPVLIDRQWEEGFVGEAIAYNEADESDSVPCWVYRLPVSEDGLYVVRYLEDGSFFAARVIREESE